MESPGRSPRCDQDLLSDKLVGFNQLDQFRWTWEVKMTRVTIGLLLLLLVLSISGCTWTETYRDYPPSIGTSEGYQHHEYRQADG